MLKLAAFSHIVFLALIATCNAAIYNVADFGAKADGKTDSSSAFVKAWAAACKSTEESTVYVPPGTFLVNSISLNGPCVSKMHLNISGVIVAPPDYKSFVSDQAWLAFNYVSGLSVDGGVIDARGASYWACKRGGNPNNCPYGARSLSLQSCNDVVISGLTSRDSQGVHFQINGCNDTIIQNLTIIAPDDSPNTDGIHIGNSNGFRIMDSNIQTGDDCISMGPGSKNMSMDNVMCGPGHGISIGSMGGDPNEDGVENIVVSNSIFTNTDNGVRIKTWPMPSNSYARDIIFRNLEMKNVSNPIIIDQQYCPTKNCPKGNSGVKVSNVTFQNITGTSRSQVALSLVCSLVDPCEEINLESTNLSYLDKTGKNQLATSRCQNAQVIGAGVVIPNCKK